MNRSRVLPFSLVLLMGFGAAQAGPVRIAVLGDSISKNRIAMGGKGWPLYLGKMLGSGYDVRTFSANGVDCLRVASRNIWSRGELPALAAFQPDVAIIMLGANTAREGLKQHKDRYGGDYRATIDYLRAIKSKPKVYCCTPIPVYEDNYGIEGKYLHEVLDPIIRAAAKQADAPLIDCYTPLKDAKGLSDDGVHPSVKGMVAIAAVVCQALTGQAPSAEVLAELAKDVPAASKNTAAPEPVDGEKEAPATDTKPGAGDAKPAGSSPRVVELKAADVRNLKGDGPDGKGNTNDDTWGFWFELAHANGKYARLDLATETLSQEQRQNGITDKKAPKGHQGKVRGPIASWLPNPKDSEGWIFHSDWDGRFEGVWGDSKADQVIAYPYVEKGSHCAVAVTFRAPAAGTYTVSGKLTDVQVQPQFEQHDGISWMIEVADGGAKGKLVANGGPIGDGHGRPDSAEFKAEKVAVKKGKLIRLVIHPNKWWGSDMTAIELRIERMGD